LCLGWARATLRYWKKGDTFLCTTTCKSISSSYLCVLDFKVFTSYSVIIKCELNIADCLCLGWARATLRCWKKGDTYLWTTTCKSMSSSLMFLTYSTLTYLLRMSSSNVYVKYLLFIFRSSEGNLTILEEGRYHV
jgi:hypothetical protein